MLNAKEEAVGSLGGLTSDFGLWDLIGLSETRDNVSDERGFVTLSSHGNRCHIGRVGLKDDATQWDNSGKHLRQMGLLKRENTTNA